MQSTSIRPDFKKMYIINFIGITLLIGGLAGFMLFFNSFVSFDVFNTALKEFGMQEIKIDAAMVTLYIAIAFVIAYIALLVLSYIQLSNVRYEILPDKIVSYTTVFFILLGSKEVPYGNIARISFENYGFFDKLFNIGDVVLELNAMEEKSFKIRHVSNPEQITQYLQNMIKHYNTRYYSQSIQDYRVEGIMDRGSI